MMHMDYVVERVDLLIHVHAILVEFEVLVENRETLLDLGELVFMDHTEVRRLDCSNVDHHVVLCEDGPLPKNGAWVEEVDIELVPFKLSEHLKLALLENVHVIRVIQLF